MAARRKFTVDELESAALRIVDGDGLAALTMRSLAAALGTAPMTLYGYVDGRDGLEELLVRAVMGRVELPEPDPADWRREVRAIVTASWRAVREHPHVIPLVLSRRTIDAVTLDWAEALLTALARSGRSGLELYAAFRTLSGLVTAYAQAELAASPRAESATGTDNALQRALSLPADHNPRMTEIAMAAAMSSPADAFGAGLDIVMAGLDADLR